MCFVTIADKIILYVSRILATIFPRRDIECASRVFSAIINADKSLPHHIKRTCVIERPVFLASSSFLFLLRVGVHLNRLSNFAGPLQKNNPFVLKSECNFPPISDAF